MDGRIVDVVDVRGGLEALRVDVVLFGRRLELDERVERPRLTEEELAFDGRIVGIKTGGLELVPIEDATAADTAVDVPSSLLSETNTI